MKLPLLGFPEEQLSATNTTPFYSCRPKPGLIVFVWWSSEYNEMRVEFADDVPKDDARRDDLKYLFLRTNGMPHNNLNVRCVQNCPIALAACIEEFIQSGREPVPAPPR